MATKRTPGQRAGLTRPMVLAAARRLLADRGLGALTMRALAAELGVAPNAVYSHVPHKEALVDDLLDDALAEVRSPVSGAPLDGLREVMIDTFRMLLAQGDLVPLYLARQGARGPNAHRLGDIMLTQLAALGVSEAARQPAVRVLIVFTVGFAAFAVRPPDSPAAVLSADELGANFATGLDWLLRGIAAGSD